MGEEGNSAMLDRSVGADKDELSVADLGQHEVIATLGRQHRGLVGQRDRDDPHVVGGGVG